MISKLSDQSPTQEVSAVKDPNCLSFFTFPTPSLGVLSKYSTFWAKIQAKFFIEYLNKPPSGFLPLPSLVSLLCLPSLISAFIASSTILRSLLLFVSNLACGAEGTSSVAFLGRYVRSVAPAGKKPGIIHLLLSSVREVSQTNGWWRKKGRRTCREHKQHLS